MILNIVILLRNKEGHTIVVEKYWLKQNKYYIFIFCNWYLAAPQPTLNHSQGDSLTDRVLITAFWLFRSEVHREPPNEVGFLSSAKRRVGFEQGTFQFQSQRLIPLPGHSWLLHAKLMNAIFYKNQTTYYKRNIYLRPFYQTTSLNLSFWWSFCH